MIYLNPFKICLGVSVLFDALYIVIAFTGLDRLLIGGTIELGAMHYSLIERKMI